MFSLKVMCGVIMFFKEISTWNFTDDWWVGITDEDIEDEWKWYGTDTIAEFTGKYVYFLCSKTVS